MAATVTDPGALLFALLTEPPADVDPVTVAQVRFLAAVYGCGHPAVVRFLPLLSGASVDFSAHGLTGV